MLLPFGSERKGFMAPVSIINSAASKIQQADLLSLLFVVETICPAVQFLGQPAQHIFSIPPGPWNDGAIDVLDSALNPALQFTGSVPKSFRYRPLFGHTSRTSLPFLFLRYAASRSLEV